MQGLAGGKGRACKGGRYGGGAGEGYTGEQEELGLGSSPDSPKRSQAARLVFLNLLGLTPLWRKGRADQSDKGVTTRQPPPHDPHQGPKGKQSEVHRESQVQVRELQQTFGCGSVPGAQRPSRGPCKPAGGRALQGWGRATVAGGDGGCLVLL